MGNYPFTCTSIERQWLSVTQRWWLYCLCCLLFRKPILSSFFLLTFWLSASERSMKEHYRLIGNMLSSHQFTKLVWNRIHRTSGRSQYLQFSPTYLNGLSTVWSTAIYRNTGFFLLSNPAFTTSLNMHMPHTPDKHSAGKHWQRTYNWPYIFRPKQDLWHLRS